MKTRKQVLKMFYDLQNKVAETFTITEIQTYRDGDYWAIKFHVSTPSHVPGEEATWKVWEDFEWNHYTYYDDDQEMTNEVGFEEYKSKLESYING